MSFDPSKLEIEPKRPTLCRFLEDAEKDERLKTVFFTCYYCGHFSEYNSPCHACDLFKERKA